MTQLRKTLRRDSSRKYQSRLIIKVSRAAYAEFTVSKLIVEQLKIDIEKEGLMFAINNKKLTVFKEEKAPDNYHLGKDNEHTYRFRSIELYNFLKDFYQIKDDKWFYLEMNADLSFDLVDLRYGVI